MSPAIPHVSCIFEVLTGDIKIVIILEIEHVKTDQKSHNDFVADFKINMKNDDSRQF